MNIIAAAKAISMAADVARTLEIQRHVASLIAAIKVKRGKGPKAKSELELMDDQIKVLGEAVTLLVDQMTVLDNLNGRLIAFEEWASLPWWKRAFSKPKLYVPQTEPSTILELPSGSTTLSR